MDGIDDDELLRRLEPCQFRGAQLMKRIVPNSDSVPQRHQRDELFTPPLAGPPHHQSVSDGRMRAQYLFDLLNEHLLASRVDHERVAAEQPQRAVLLDAGPVPRYHDPPTHNLGKSPAGGTGIVEVAQRDSPFTGHPADLWLARFEKSGIVL